VARGHSEAIASHQLWQLGVAWQTWCEFSQTAIAYGALDTWMARLFATTHDNALAGIRRASDARARAIGSELDSTRLNVRRYIQRQQAVHVAHVVLRKTMQALKATMLAWRSLTVANQTVRHTSHSKQLLVANIIVRNIRAASDTLRVNRLSHGLLMWSTVVSSAHRWRQHSFQLALAMAAKNHNVRARHALQLAFTKIRTKSAMRAMLARAANERFLAEENQRDEQRRLIANMMGNRMQTAVVELHLGRLSRGFGMWRTFVQTAQESRRASFGAHMHSYVRHSRRIVLQWGFRRWLVWTWQDRFSTLNEQFGLCQTALGDLETDVKRLEAENADLETSRISERADYRNEISIEAQQSSLHVQQMSMERDQLIEQNHELRNQTQKLIADMETMSTLYSSQRTDTPTQGLSRSLLSPRAPSTGGRTPRTPRGQGL